ncbi:MAG: mannitol-1-phosphate 5-dehydrogenase [Chloroflexota bacterium]
MAGQAVILGAGNVGRGFLGQLFCESGYAVTFVDIDERLIAAFNARGRYALRLVDNDHSQELTVGPVRGLLSGQGGAAIAALAEATLAATAVGARALPYIAPLLAGAIARRAQQGIEAPLNVIVCENLRGAASIFRAMVAEHLDAAAQDYLAGHIGFVDTVIGRMVPDLSPALRAEDPSLIIAEPYKELPVDRAGFVGAPPDLVGMEPCDNFPLYTARKLYLHNAGHAVLGYLGYQRGHALGYEALADAEVHAVLAGALDEAQRGIAARYGSSADWLRAHVDDLLRRFGNRVLADPIARLARDPLRKLAPEDRLVGAARVAEAVGMVPLNLAWGIASALAYDAPGDALAAELQRRIAAEGVEAVLRNMCQIAPDESLGEAVLARYGELVRARAGRATGERGP